MRVVHAAIVLFLAAGCSSSTTVEQAQAPQAGREAGPHDAPPAQAGEVNARRVVHTAILELSVEDLDAARKQLVRLVEDAKGFVAGSESGGSPGVPRAGRWTVRIPVARYDGFLDSIAHLGEMQHARTDAQDVTEQFVDLDARLKNKRVEEQRLQEHLKSSTGKLDDILAVERELARVRGEIEQAQAHLQKLAGLSDLATVTISLRERKGYMSPEAPTFMTAIGRTFGGSLDLLTRAGKATVLFVVALAPWLPVLAGVGACGWVVNRRRKVMRARPVPSAE